MRTIADEPGVSAPSEDADREPVSHRLYAQAAWGTLHGLPMVSPRFALLLEGELISLARRLDVEPVEVSAESRRVRILLRFKPSQPLAPVVLRLKRGADRAARRHGAAARWARGWAVATVRPEEVRDLRRRLSASSLGVRRLTAGLRDG